MTVDMLHLYITNNINYCSIVMFVLLYLFCSLFIILWLGTLLSGLGKFNSEVDAQFWIRYTRFWQYSLYFDFDKLHSDLDWIPGVLSSVHWILTWVNCFMNWVSFEHRSTVVILLSDIHALHSDLCKLCITFWCGLYSAFILSWLWRGYSAFWLVFRYIT
jgi:hypothetical protein